MAAVIDARAVPVPVQPENIPDELKRAKRWVPWIATWDGKKWQKKPSRVDRPGVGLTDWAKQGWTDFESALRIYEQNRHVLGGVGYVMTDSQGLIGVDFDHCVDVAGNIAPWAADQIAKLDSYTELSPSGTGLRIFLAGDAAEDWMSDRNSKAAIEVYTGAGGRFLTVTGARLDGSRKTIERPAPAAFDSFRARYRKTATTADVEDLHLPAIIPDVLLPDWRELDLPAKAANFLHAGPSSNDRSGELFYTAIALCQAGLDREEVFSTLANNEHALELAADHWKGSEEKALRFLWKHSALKGTARAEGIRKELVDEFPDYDDPANPLEVAAPAAPQAVDPIDDFDDLDAGEQHQQAAPANVEKPAKVKFELLTPLEFMSGPPPSWLVRDALPKAGLAVVYGASGSGKSFFVLDLSMAIVRGVEWRGKPVAKGRGVYIVAEGAGGFRKRLEAYCRQHDVDPGQLDIRFVKVAPNLISKPDIDELIVQLRTMGRLDFVVVDTYARAMAGANENDAKDVGDAVKQCDRIHRATGALVVLVHHSGKDEAKGARGSGALRAAADAEIQVTKYGALREAVVTKQKDGADDAKFQFKLHEVELGTDEEGFPITSCVVEHRENEARPTTASGRPLTPFQDIVVRTLADAMGLGDEPVHVAELKRLVLERVPKNPEKKVDNRGRDFDKAVPVLVDSGIFEIDERSYLTIAENRN